MHHNIGLESWHIDIRPSKDVVVLIQQGYHPIFNFPFNMDSIATMRAQCLSQDSPQDANQHLVRDLFSCLSLDQEAPRGGLNIVSILCLVSLEVEPDVKTWILLNQIGLVDVACQNFEKETSFKLELCHFFQTFISSSSLFSSSFFLLLCLSFSLFLSFFLFSLFPFWN